MIHFDYEEAICDNPVTSFFFPWTASGCGWISPIHFAWPLACCRSRLCPNPWPVSTWEYFAQIILLPWDVHWVYEWMYKPINILCCRGWEVWVWLTLLPWGTEGRGSSLPLCISCTRGSWKGPKGWFGNTSSPESLSDTETGPCSSSRKDQLGLGCSLKIPVQAEPSYWDVSPALRV